MAEPNRAFGLYVHIPYCDSKCPYCDFNSHVVARIPEGDYVRALERELTLRSQEPAWRDREVATIFFGGGTPSLFAPSSIAALLARVGDLWPAARDAEVTLEANPGTVSRGQLDGLLAAGINRISFGVQSFHPEHLRTLGRIHSADDAAAALVAARAAGFVRINLDLIFAVPGQTLEQWCADLERAIEFGTSHVSAYNLTYEEGTPFHRWRREGRLRPLDEDLEAEMFEATAEVLARAGLCAYEISNFASPDQECRHNENYWRAGDYLGVGAGAHTFSLAGAPPYGRRCSNLRGPAAYVQRLQAGVVAEATAEILQRQQAAGEFAFLNLRRRRGFSERRFVERFGARFEQEFPAVLPFVDDGLVEQTGQRWRLTDAGVRVADAVFAQFL